MNLSSYKTNIPFCRDCTSFIVQSSAPFSRRHLLYSLWHFPPLPFLCFVPLYVLWVILPTWSSIQPVWHLGGPPHHACSPHHACLTSQHSTHLKTRLYSFKVATSCDTEMTPRFDAFFEVRHFPKVVIPRTGPPELVPVFSWTTSIRGPLQYGDHFNTRTT